VSDKNSTYLISSERIVSIPFPEELILGIPEIDQQHKELFAVYRDFSDAIDNGQCSSSHFELIARLEKLTTTHIRYEEHLIHKSKYPNAEIHIIEHNLIIEDIKKFKSAIGSKGVSKEVLLSLKRFLIRYLLNHTKKSDMLLCGHLIELQLESDTSSIGYATSTKFRKIGEILVDLNIISRSTLNMALDIQKTGGKKIGEVLIEMGATKAEDVIEAFAIQMGILKFPLEQSENTVVV